MQLLREEGSPTPQAPGAARLAGDKPGAARLAGDKAPGAARLAGDKPRGEIMAAGSGGSKGSKG